MRAKLSVCTSLFLVMLAYALSPYIALWRLEAAVERGDTVALERGIDWRSVRDGLKQDIADGIIGPAQTQTQLTANALPPFGASFITGIADTAIDRDVTPQNLIAVMRQMRPAEKSRNPFSCFAWAFFESPTAFTVTVRNEDDEGDESHLRLRMELHHGRWMLMRAWVPQDLVERASQRT